MGATHIPPDLVLTPGNVGNSTTVAGAISNLDDSQTAQGDSGFGSWTGAQDGVVTISNATPAVVTKTAHGLSASKKIMFQTTGSLPSGVSVATTYFVLATGLTADTFQISLTDGGAAINTTTAGSGVHTMIVSAYSITGTTLSVIRPGIGYILGRKVAWTAPQSVSNFTPNAAHWVYINSSGTAAISTSRTHALYRDNIILFEVHYDGADSEVMLENHEVSYDLNVEEFIHESVGTILTPIEGTNVIGADMVRVATGTGASADDRRIKIVGDADVNDGGISNRIPDSAGVGVLWKFYYTNGSGNWTELSSSSEFPIQYNNAGTMTNLTGGGSTDHGLWTCYVVKSDPNTGRPIYVAVAHTEQFGTIADALSVVAAGTNVVATGTLFQAMEPAQLGHVVVTSNGSGYIASVNIAKSTMKSAISGGGGSSAGTEVTSVTNFNGMLGASNTTSQSCFETIDDFVFRQFNAQVGTAYTLALTDIAKVVTMTNAAASTLTIPTNAVVAFPVGSYIDIIQNGAGKVTIAGAGVTIKSKGALLSLSAQYGHVRLLKEATDTWYVLGEVIA